MGARDIYRVLVDSAQISAVVMIIISLAGIFAWGGSTLGAFDAAAKLITSLSDTSYIVMAMNVAIGQFTPPVAVNLIVTAKIAGVPIESTVRWVIWPIIAMIMAIALVIIFPPIALWLPAVMGFQI